MPATAATIVPLLFVLRIDEGIWKSVVEPVFETEKSVEVAMPPVVEEILKSEVLVSPKFAERENLANSAHKVCARVKCKRSSKGLGERAVAKLDSAG